MRIFIFILTIIAALASPVYAGQNEFAGTIVGAAVGGVIGGEIGRSMDRADLYYNSPAYAYYEPRPVYYSSNYYTPNYVAPPAPPPPIYMDDDTGNYCREFSQTIRMNGQVRESYGTVCLQPDGSWRVVE